MTTPPTGTVTFLFTDIEGSTTRWEHQREAMAAALDRHNDLLAAAIADHGGHVFKTVGDAFHAAFASAADAVAAAVAAQHALHGEPWAVFGDDFAPLRVRMGIHTGTVEWRDGDYFGQPLNRTARLMASGHGGQVLLSLATQQLVRDALPAGCTLRDLGLHRLKDLRHSEHLFRLVVADLPDVATPPDSAQELRPGERAIFDAALLPAECPYRGLHAFREVDAPLFFGREVFTDLLVGAATAAPMVGVIGPSGSGKSSVVFAGLVPRLRARGAGAGRWLVTEMRPGGRPYHALAGALVPLVTGAELTEIDRLAEVNKLAGYLRDRAVAPRDVLARIGEQQPDLGRVVLVADQFEELYTLCADEDEQRAFQDLLFAAAFDGGALPLTLALTLRADFMGHALAYRPFADAIQHHQVVLGPMTRDELGRAIRLPAEKQGRSFETGLVERIVDDVGEKAGTLPLLEFALTKLWEQQSEGWLTHDAYEAIGRVEGAVARHADTVYDALGSGQQEQARRVFVQLVQPGEGTEDTRRSATREEIGENWPLLRKLADARLVTTGRDGAGHETAEVVHEALIRSWGQLRDWMNADRTFRTWQERLRFALRQWAASDHDEGTLLRGAPLAEAEGWLGERGEELGAAERDFVEEGVHERDREMRERQAQFEREVASARNLRRQRVFLSIALAAAMVLAGIAAVLGNRSRLATARAEATSADAFARELAGASLANRERDPELSVLLALQAISVSETSGGVPVPEPLRALHLALQHTRRRQTIVAHEGGVNDVAVSPDGLRIATCGNDGIKLWDLATGTAVLTITEAITTVATVAFSPDGALLASGGPDGAVRLWDAGTGDDVRRLDGHTDAVTQVAFSPDGARVASASKDKSAIVWDVRAGAALVTLAGHTGAVNSVAWSPDGARVASGGADLSAKLWDVGTGQPFLEIALFPLQPVQGVSFSPDGTQLATFNADTRIWDASTGDLVQVLRGHSDVVNEGAFSPDGRMLLTASRDKTAGVWAATGVEAAIVPLLFKLTGHHSTIDDVAFSPDGRQAITGSRDGTVGVWDVTRAQAWRSLTTRSSTSSRGVVFSPSGSSVAAASRDGVARVWHLGSASDTAVISFTGHVSEVWAIAFSPDGRTVATTSKDRAAMLWDAESGKHIRTMTGHTDWVGGVTFSPDGARLATSSKDATVKVWDAHSGEMLMTLVGHSDWVNEARYSPDGSRMVTASEDEVAKVWDAASGRDLLTLSGHSGNIYRVRFSPDGRKIATASDEDRTARVWDAITGKELFSITGHLQPVQGVDFSPDGAQLATSSWDGAVKVWDATTGEALATVAESAGVLIDLKYSPGGGHIAVGSAAPYGNIYIFTLRQDELIALARKRVKRTLTEEECRVYLHAAACPDDG